jgi:hypothetical protein
MNFGKWVVVAFIAFASYIIFLVVVCMKQDINLVSKHYYSDELKYQEKLNRINNAARLQYLPSIEIQNGIVQISFASDQAIQKGLLKIERPSDENLDRNYSLMQGQAIQKFDLHGWKPGLYRTSVTWTMDGREFYFEKQIVL